MLLGLVLAADLGFTWVRFRPRVVALVTTAPEKTAYMARREAEGRPPRSRQWAPLGSLPSLLVCAVVAAEDRRFFLYGTVDWRSQLYAAHRAIRGDLSRGGSGITQQLARNLFLGPQRTVRRKLREYVLTYQIAHTLSKERQLELYLNVVEWADGVWGVAAASRHLFGRDPNHLTPTEMVLLAKLLPAPSLGLRFPLLPKNRRKLEIITKSLWRDGLLDDLTRSATAARLQRMGQLTDSGLEPTAAIEVTRNEMGPESVAMVDASADSLPLARRCDRQRRGIRLE